MPNWNLCQVRGRRRPRCGSEERPSRCCPLSWPGPHVTLCTLTPTVKFPLSQTHPQMSIENFKRSPPAVFKIDVAVSAKTSAAQLESLRRRLDGYLSSQPLAWKPTCFIRCGGLRDQTLLLSVWCSSHYMWQDAARLFRASFLLHLALVEFLTECDISFRLADQSLRLEGAINTRIIPGGDTMQHVGSDDVTAAFRSGGGGGGGGDKSGRRSSFKLQLPPVREGVAVPTVDPVSANPAQSATGAGFEQRRVAQMPAASALGPPASAAAPTLDAAAPSSLSLEEMGALLHRMQAQYEAMASAATAHVASSGSR